jgi:hypothetical protein
MINLAERGMKKGNLLLPPFILPSSADLSLNPKDTNFNRCPRMIREALASKVV